MLLSLNDDDISVGPRAEINDFDGKILSLSWYDCNLFISGRMEREKSVALSLLSARKQADVF